MFVLGIGAGQMIGDMRLGGGRMVITRIMEGRDRGRGEDIVRGGVYVLLVWGQMEQTT